RDLPPFPTRRSSDLDIVPLAIAGLAPQPGLVHWTEGHLLFEKCLEQRLGMLVFIGKSGDAGQTQDQSEQDCTQHNYSRRLVFSRSEEHTSELQSREN